METNRLMKRCIRLAAKAAGSTSPNPMVGALLYKDGAIIAEDYHRKAGTPHAEALVLAKAKEAARGASLFVTLEPCCHRNKRTPPCAEAIIEAGVKEVVLAMEDPNPLVAGKGTEALKKAGIAVRSGVEEEQARKLNEAYTKYITTRIPFTILKTAMTLDGKIADWQGESKWITGEEARKVVHHTRSAVDAVLSAIGTVKADNPQFTARVKGAAKDPLRVIIDPRFETPDDFHVLKTPPPTLFVTATCDARTERFRTPGVDFLHYNGRLDLKWLMEELGARAITSVLIEGGSSLAAHALEDGVVDKVMFFIAPKILGGKDSFLSVGGANMRRLSEAYAVDNMTVRKTGKDILIEGYIR